MSTPELVGEIEDRSGDGFPRKWKVWAHTEPDGELTAITYGFGLATSYGPITRDQCDTDLRQKLWSFAENQLQIGLQFDHENDQSVIEEPPSDNVISFSFRRWQ